MNDATPTLRWAAMLAVAAFALVAPGNMVRVAVLGLGGLALVPLLGWLRVLSFVPVLAAGVAAAAAAWLLGAGQAVPVAFVVATAVGAGAGGLAHMVWPERPPGAAVWVSLVAAVAVWSVGLPRLVAAPAQQSLLFGVDLAGPRALGVVAALLLLAGAAALGNVARSQAGREIAAAGAAPELALRSGATVAAARVRAGLLAGLLAGWAGFVLTLQAHALPPLAQLSPAAAVGMLAVALLGGIGSVPGALLAALVIGGVAPALGLPELGVAGLLLAGAAVGGGPGLLGLVRRAPEPQADAA